jgi:hypothetical protein
MVKLIKGGNVQNIITDGDVIVTSLSKIGKTLDKVLVEQQSDIDKLKSNVKYIYAYGGVGGSGSGGSGSGANANPYAIITLDRYSVENGGETIILGSRGTYTLHVKINNPGGKTFYMGYNLNGSVTNQMMRYKIDGSIRYNLDTDIYLNKNGDLSIRIEDEEGNTLLIWNQTYLVDTDMLNITLNFIDGNNDIQSYPSEPYECFVTDPNRNNRYFNIDYSIFLTNYSDAKLKCVVDGIDTPIYETDLLAGSGNVKIYLGDKGDESDILINGESILQNKYMGTYTLNTTLSYKVTGSDVVKSINRQFSIIPYGLYINVRTLSNVLYDDLETLKNDMKNGED